jgi:hypothetical protein
MSCIRSDRIPPNTAGVCSKRLLSGRIGTMMVTDSTGTRLTLHALGVGARIERRGRNRSAVLGASSGTVLVDAGYGASAAFRQGLNARG